MATTVAITRTWVTPTGTVNTDRVVLTDGSIGYLASLDGCGFPPLHAINTQFPNKSYGITDISGYPNSNLGSYRLDPRTITLRLKLIGTSLADLYNKQISLEQVVTPLQSDYTLWNTNQLALEITNSAGSVYKINVQTISLDMSLSKRKGYLQEVSLQFYCPDPLFTGAASSSIVWTSNNTQLVQVPGTFIDSSMRLYLNGGPSNPSTTPGVSGTITLSNGVSSYAGVPATVKIILNSVSVPAGATWVLDFSADQRTLVEITNTAFLTNGYNLVGTSKIGWLDPSSTCVTLPIGGTGYNTTGSTTPYEYIGNDGIYYQFSLSGASFGGPIELAFYPRYIGISV